MLDRVSGSARQLERITSIDRVLRDGRCPTTSDLAQELGVSERTVYRDLVFLRDRLGAPVVFDGRRRGYRYTRPHRFFPGISLSTQEILALLLAARVATPLLGHLFGEKLRQVVQRILWNGGIKRLASAGDALRSSTSGEFEVEAGGKRSGQDPAERSAPSRRAAHKVR